MSPCLSSRGAAGLLVVELVVVVVAVVVVVVYLWPRNFNMPADEALSRANSMCAPPPPRRYIPPHVATLVTLLIRGSL